MSLNNISLPAHLLVELYSNNLVQGEGKAVPQSKPVRFLGKNEKNILVIVNHQSVPYLPDAELQFLTAVLSACQLDLSHVAIVNWQNAEVKGADVLRQLSPKQILFLNVSPDVLNFSPDTLPYTVEKKGTIQFVQAPSLTDIEKTKQTKSQLWLALKQLFCL